MIEILLALIAGIWIGKTVTNAMNQIAFGQILKDLGVTEQDLKRVKQQLDQQLDPDKTTDEIIEIKLEQHQGQIYAFRKDTDQFLGQGPDREQLIERLQSQFSTRVTLIVREADGANLIKS